MKITNKDDELKRNHFEMSKDMSNKLGVSGYMKIFISE